MPDPSLPATVAPNGDVGLLSPGTRTTISFLLFLHFFALAVGVASSWSPSPLTSAIRNVPTVGPYLELLWLDVSYFPLHRLTQGNPDDTDDVIEIEIVTSDGSSEATTLPSAEIWPHQRYRRYARLAQHVAGLASVKELESLLPQDLAAHYAARSAARVSKGSLHCRRHLMLTMDDALSLDRPMRDPFAERLYENVYSASVHRFRNQIRVHKQEAAGENAPAAPGGKETP
jgi:hypothetical protein